jgi:hypothetical protein
MRGDKMGDTVENTINTIRKLPTRLMDKIRPMKSPGLALSQPQNLGEMLPYESIIDIEGLSSVVMSDGSMGVVWEIAPLPHEVIKLEVLKAQVDAITKVLESVSNDSTNFQLIWDSTPHKSFAVPDYANHPVTYPQKVMVERIKAVQRRADSPEAGLSCIRRRLYLCFRVQASGRLGLDSKGGALGGTLTSAMEDQLEILAKTQDVLVAQSKIIEDGLSHCSLSWRRCDGQSFLQLVRCGLHSYEFSRDKLAFSGRLMAGERLSDQVLMDFTEMVPWGIQLGNSASSSPDSIQVLSWAQQPPQAFVGMMAHLFSIREPVRVVLNLRPCVDVSDMDRNATLLRRSIDARGKRQLTEIQETQTRMTYGEKLMWVSLHVFVRNVGVSVQDLKKRDGSRSVANSLNQSTGIPLLTEQYAAPAVFLLCLPLCYRPDAGRFVQRERRVLSASLGCYLPVFGGFPGTRTQSQLLQNRVSDPIYLCTRDSNTSAHAAILGSSGSGKSFFLANLLCSEKAAVPDSLDFIIDNKTSYEVFAKLCGEEKGFLIAKPPESFPNIFLGRADNERIGVIVGILRTAISLANPGFQITSEYDMLLKLSVQKTFDDNYIDAETSFSDGIIVERSTIGKVVVPRLSDVVDKFTQVCRQLDLQTEHAQILRAKLGPFFGKGQYAAMFDQDCVADAEPPTPSVTLFDLQDVATDPILCTLTSQICISEIIRQIKRSENKNKSGRLVIEEAGVLGARSSELVDFVREAWKTFRKLGYSCIGLTNSVEDYREKEAPRVIWQISPNKVILPMSHEDIELSITEDEKKGIPKFLTDDVAEVVRTLTKLDGVYSQGFWWSSDIKGSFIYAPTGFDYWLAASKRKEVNGTVDRIAHRLGSYWRAIHWLANHHPFGFSDKNATDKVREINEDELNAIPLDYKI